MGIFDSIKNAIFRRPAPASPAPEQPSPAASHTTTASTAPQPKTPTAAPPAPAQAVDVEAVLESLAAKNSQKLNWRTSIVDLMKLLELDSSLSNRKELAKELGYSGDPGDSAAMNVWLHKQVMAKLAESGGKVPASLRS